jgi:uncharacterized membrane protein YczE
MSRVGAVSGLVRRLVQLYVGLIAYCAGAAFQVRSGLGLDPWDVFHQGIARHLHVSLGLVVIAVGAIVLLGWIPLRQRPGLGTISNVIVLGSALDAVLAVLPTPHQLAVRIGFLVAGIVLIAAATGMYIGANFGPGPRDGLMTGIARRTGASIRLTRTAIELTVLLAGWLLGGTVGIGTLAFALAIGPLAQVFLRLFSAGSAGSAGSAESVGSVGSVGLAIGLASDQVDLHSAPEVAALP